MTEKVSSLDMETSTFLEVHCFDRSNGGKKTTKNSIEKTALTEKQLAEMPKNFCKKDPKTGVQKLIRCLACQCQVESAGALKDHLGGEKHAINLEVFGRKKTEKQFKKPKNTPVDFKSQHFDINKSLEDKLRQYSGPLIGLDKVQEFTCPSNKSSVLMYKCQVFSCDGAWGTSKEFFDHFCSRNHAVNYLIDHTDLYAAKDRQNLMKMSQQEFLENTKTIKSCIKDIEVIDDEDRYWIQRNRSAPKKKDPVSLVPTTSTSTPVVVPTSSLCHAADLGDFVRCSSAVSVNAATSIGPANTIKRKLEDILAEPKTDVKKAKLETKALKAKRPGFTDERYNETSYYHEIDNNLRKVYPYYFTFTTFTKGRWVGERILDVFAREFRAHPAEEYERCIKAGTLTVNYEKVDIDYRLKHNDLLANIVHRHEVPVSSEEINIVHIDDDLVVVNKPASIPVHPCGRYRHNTVVFILAKEHGLKNLRTIHRLDRLTSGLLLFGRNPKKAREMEQQIRTRQVQKEYVCRVDGEFPEDPVTCKEPIEVVSYKIGVCKVSPNGKDCHTDFHRLSFNGRTSVVLCKPRTGRMHQIRVHLQYLGYPVVNDPLYNHVVFGPEKGRGGRIGKTDDQLIQDLISIHNAENWLGMDDDGPGLGPAPTVQPSAISPTVSKEGEKKVRAETPDSAVDVQSLPTSADSPSSSSTASTTSCDFHVDNVGTTVKPAVAAAATVAVGSGNDDSDKVTIATQTGIEEADKRFDIAKLSVDPHCYECKVKYRDPRPKDLVMFLHAWTYSGPDWQYKTDLPSWAQENWVDPEDYLD